MARPGTHGPAPAINEADQDHAVVSWLTLSPTTSTPQHPGSADLDHPAGGAVIDPSGVLPGHFEYHLGAALACVDLAGPARGEHLLLRGTPCPVWITTSGRATGRAGSSCNLGCAELGITSKRTRPTGRRPTARSNDSTERWPRAGPTLGSTTQPEQRNAALPAWLHFYNHRRPHAAIGGKPPVTRLTNLPGHHT